MKNYVYVVKVLEEIMVFSSLERAVASINDYLDKEDVSFDAVSFRIDSYGVCAGTEWQIAKEEVR